MLPVSPTAPDRMFAKITWRLIPLLFLCYVVAYIDRINVGFAKLQLREALGVDEQVFGSVYGFGAGLFFIGYFLFEVPSNLILQRVGARHLDRPHHGDLGLVSAAMMFIEQHDRRSTSMRFLLGVAEAGFFPGVILYLTYWFPARERAKTVALFATGGLIAGIIGSPISGAILGLDGACGSGRVAVAVPHSKAIPAVVLGVVVLFVLPNGPAGRRLARRGTRNSGWLRRRSPRRRRTAGANERSHLATAFTSGTRLAAVPALLPAQRRRLRLRDVAALDRQGVLGAERLPGGPHQRRSLPRGGGRHALVRPALRPDRGAALARGGRGAIASAVGFVLTGCLQNPWLAMAALTLAFVGLKSTLGPFWALGTAFLERHGGSGRHRPHQLGGQPRRLRRGRRWSASSATARAATSPRCSCSAARCCSWASSRCWWGSSGHAQSQGAPAGPRHPTRDAAGTPDARLAE